MYTQCPDCGTVFRVTADVLRVAQGDVRCGVCSTSFNALESLRDEPRALPDDGAPEDTITVEELPGNEMIELSSAEAEAANAPAIGEDEGEQSHPAREAGPEEDAGAGESADESQWPAFIAQTSVESRKDASGEPREASADDVPAAGAKIGAGGDEAAGSADEEEVLEFHGTAEDLDRVFMLPPEPPGEPARPPSQRPLDDAIDELLRALDEASRADLSGIKVEEQPVYAEPAGENEAPAAGTGPEAEFELELYDDETDAGTRAGTRDLDRTDEYPILVLDERDEGTTAGTQPPPEASEAPPPAVDRPAADRKKAPEREPEEPRFLIPEELRRDLAAGAPRPDAGGLELAAGDDLGLSALESAREEGRRWPWVAAAVLLAVALGAQAIHFWRDDLARDPLAGPWVLGAYGALGLPIDTPADLAAFDLRQWGATSDPTEAGRLRLRATIVNRAVFAQPYPLLRLSLQDRFGNTIGVRDVAPADYLPGGAAAGGALLGAGQRADAEIVFVDPGRDAVGFELDLCLSAGPGVRCANAAAP